MATENFDTYMQAPIHVLVNETSDPSLTYDSGSADNTFIQTARGFVPYPMMQHTGYFHWIVAGVITLIGSANTIEVQVVIDGAAVSGVLSFPTGAAIATPGTFTLELWVYPIASTIANKEQQQAIRARMTFNDGTSHIALVETTNGMTVDTHVQAGHTMGLQIRKQLATVNHFLTVHSQFCYRLGGRSGS